MSTAYISSRFPVGFKQAAYADVQNGSQALASLVYNIADNQQWLASEDVDIVNFHQGWAGLTKEWTGTTNTIRILIPPFCQHAGFHFYVARDLDIANDSQPVVDNGIQVSVLAGGSRTIHNVRFGEDLTATAKVVMANDSYGWEHIDGVSLNATDYDQSALKLVSATSETWTSVRVAITMGTKVYCRAAAYHIIPNRTGYIVTV